MNRILEMRRLKKIVLFSFLVSAIISCSQEELEDAQGNIPKGKIREVEVTLKLGVNSGMYLSGRSAGTPTDYVTRAGEVATEDVKPRELTTIDDAQQVNDMRIYVFRSETENEDGYKFYIPQDLTQDKPYYDISAMGIFNHAEPYYSEKKGGYETQTVTLKPKLEEGYYYKFLAVGRDDKYAEPLNKNTKEWGYKALKEPQFVQGETTFKDASISGVAISLVDKSNGEFYTNTLWCTELFSGIMRNGEIEDFIKVESGSTGFSKTIKLKRAVAGLMMYVTRIPCSVKDNSSDWGEGGDGYGDMFQPQSVAIKARYASGAVGLVDRIPATGDKSGTGSTSTWITLAFINLSEKNGWKANTESGIFEREEDKEHGWAEDSYMSSNYLMPADLENIKKYAGENGATFVLEYTQYDDENGIHYYRYERIKVKQPKDGAQYLFPIQANYLYALGKIGTGVNDPYPLTPDGGGDGGNEIVIEVVPDWDWDGELEWQ